MTHQKNSVALTTLIAIVIGNALEWYDFIIYSFMTVFIAEAFFPAVNHTNSLLAATATFGAGFFMRPIGAVILGIYADKKGRKTVMTLVMSLMSIALLILACAPTYAYAGMLAPCLILIARLLQGFSAAGEFGSSTALLLEIAPAHCRGLYGAWQMFGQMSAVLLGGSIGMLLTHFLSPIQLQSWGWRIPFITGLIIAPVGLYIRRHLNEEISSNTAAQQNHSAPKIKNMLFAMGLTLAGTTSFYVNIIFMPTYASKYLFIPMNHAFIATTIGALVSVICIPMLGSLSDKLNRLNMLIGSLTAYLIILPFVFVWMTSQPTAAKLITCEIIFCLTLAPYLAVFTTILAELFPKKIRATGLSISNNLAIMLFGGFGQFIVTWLIHLSGSLLAPAFYTAFGTAVSLSAAILLSKEKAVINEYANMARAAHPV